MSQARHRNTHARDQVDMATDYLLDDRAATYSKAVGLLAMAHSVPTP